jgi:hypothetical protein
MCVLYAHAHTVRTTDTQPGVIFITRIFLYQGLSNFSAGVPPYAI